MKRVLFIFAIWGVTAVVAFGQSRENRTVSGFTGINASNTLTSRCNEEIWNRL